MLSLEDADIAHIVVDGVDGRAVPMTRKLGDDSFL